MKKEKNQLLVRLCYTLILLIFAPLIFAHPSKMNFHAPFNFRASHNFRGTLGVFLMKNIDKEGKKETKFELLLTFEARSFSINWF